MARQRKRGLDYFSLDVDFFSADTRIRILKARYGADGITIFLYLLCEIYKNGYYLKVDEDFWYVMSHDLDMSTDKVKQVLTFLLERSLFDNKLFQSDAVLTSAGIQKRFQLAVKERARKNPIKISGYWLLEKEETEPFIKVTRFQDDSGKNENKSGKNTDNSAEKSLKESKVNKTYIYFSNPELEEVFRLFISMRNHNQKSPLMPEQIEGLRQELSAMGKDDAERIAICKQAFNRGWKGFYPIKKESGKKTQAGTKKAATGNANGFHNFDEREYDYDALEKKLADKRKNQ